MTCWGQSHFYYLRLFSTEEEVGASLQKPQKKPHMNQKAIIMAEQKE